MAGPLYHRGMTRAGRNRRLLLGAATALLTLSACAALAELSIRAFGLAPELYEVRRGRFRISSNPRIGYELVPHFESEVGGPMLDFAGRANSLGFRDREHALQKPEGAYRILVLGDSITQGLGVKHDRDLFTAVLERRLGARGADAEVLNFGVSGYNTQQEVETLRDKGLRYAPDLVVLAFCVNDDELVSGGILNVLSAEQSKQSLIRKAPALAKQSALARFLLGLRYARPIAGHDAVEADFGAIMGNTVPEYVEVLADLSSEHDFAVLVVWFPRLKGADEDDGALFADVERMSASAGFHFLDLSPHFAACAREAEIALDSFHPNARGHRCAGEAIARRIGDEIPGGG